VMVTQDPGLHDGLASTMKSIFISK
jgi:hypothetical protein